MNGLAWRGPLMEASIPSPFINRQMPVQVNLGTGVAHSKRGGLGGWSVADPGSGEHNVGEGETIESQRQGWTGGCTCDGGGESWVVVVDGGGFAVRHVSGRAGGKKRERRR